MVVSNKHLVPIGDDATGSDSYQLGNADPSFDVQSQEASYCNTPFLQSSDPTRDTHSGRLEVDNEQTSNGSDIVSPDEMISDSISNRDDNDNISNSESNDHHFVRRSTRVPKQTKFYGQ